MAGGGRRPGAGNPGRPHEIQLEAREIMKEKNYNPIEALIDIAQDTDTETDMQFQCGKELAKYYAPQLKSIDVKASVNSRLIVKLTQFGEQLKADGVPALGSSELMEELDTMTEDEEEA